MDYSLCQENIISSGPVASKIYKTSSTLDYKN